MVKNIGIILILITVMSADALLAAECLPRTLEAGDKIMTKNQSNPLGRVRSVLDNGYVKISGIPWPSDQAYPQSRFCLYLPAESYKGYEAGQTIIKFGSDMGQKYNILEVTENGFIALNSGANFGEKRFWNYNGFAYKHALYESVDSYGQFEKGDCVFKKHTGDSIPLNRQSHRITDIIKQGYIKTNKTYATYYRKHTWLELDPDEGCKWFFEKW